MFQNLIAVPETDTYLIIYKTLRSFSDGFVNLEGLKRVTLIIVLKKFVQDSKESNKNNKCIFVKVKLLLWICYFSMLNLVECNLNFLDGNRIRTVSYLTFLASYL